MNVNPYVSWLNALPYCGFHFIHQIEEGRYRQIARHALFQDVQISPQVTETIESSLQAEIRQLTPDTIRSSSFQNVVPLARAVHILGLWILFKGWKPTHKGLEDVLKSQCNAVFPHECASFYDTLYLEESSPQTLLNHFLSSNISEATPQAARIFQKLEHYALQPQVFISPAEFFAACCKWIVLCPQEKERLQPVLEKGFHGEIFLADEKLWLKQILKPYMAHIAALKECWLVETPKDGLDVSSLPGLAGIPYQAEWCPIRQQRTLQLLQRHGVQYLPPFFEALGAFQRLEIANLMLVRELIGSWPKGKPNSSIEILVLFYGYDATLTNAELLALWRCFTSVTTVLIENLASWPDNAAFKNKTLLAAHSIGQLRKENKYLASSNRFYFDLESTDIKLQRVALPLLETLYQVGTSCPERLVHFDASESTISDRDLQLFLTCLGEKRALQTVILDECKQLTGKGIIALAHPALEELSLKKIPRVTLEDLRLLLQRRSIPVLRVLPTENLTEPEIATLFKEFPQTGKAKKSKKRER